MSRNPFVRAIVSDIADAFLDVGACVLGTYTNVDGASISGRMFISRGVSLIGPQGQVLNNRTTIRLVAGDFESLGELGEHGDTIETGDEVFVVDSVIPTDQSAGIGAEGTLTVLVVAGAI